MKTFSLAALHGALLAALLAAALPAQQEHTFHVGTWNLEFLGAGGNFRNNTPPRLDADYAAIGRKVVELGVCVLAVQEINDEVALRKVTAGAGASWDAVLGTSGGWDDGATAQRIGFVFDRARVELLHAEELLQLPREFEGEPIFHRVPVTACFRHKASGCDFRLVTVHLKAGQKATDAQKRRGEATALAGWLDTLAADPNEDPDVVLLGDFNSTYGAEPETLFEQSQRRRYLEPRTKQPTIMHFADPIDQVVGAVACKELRVDSLAIDGDFDGMRREAWRQTYSDHFPVVATLVAKGDDDPKATFAKGPASQQLPRDAAVERRVRSDRPVRPAAGTEADANAPKGAVRPWPPEVGQNVRVIVTMGNSVANVAGKLLAPVPEGPGGWVVIDAGGEVRAVPYAMVASILVQ